MSFAALWPRGRLRVLTSARRSRSHQLHLRVQPPFEDSCLDGILLVLGFQGRLLYGYDLFRRLMLGSLSVQPGVFSLLRLTVPSGHAVEWANPLAPLADELLALRSEGTVLPLGMSLDGEQLHVAGHIASSRDCLHWIDARAGSGKSSIVKLLLHLWVSHDVGNVWILQPTRVLREATAVEHLITEKAGVLVCLVLWTVSTAVAFLAPG